MFRLVFYVYGLDISVYISADLYISAGHVEAGIWLPGHVGCPDWRQLQGRDPGAAHGPGQDEEPHHQTLEAPDWHTHPGQLPGRPAKLRLQPSCSGQLCRLNPLLHDLLLLHRCLQTPAHLALLEHFRSYTVWNAAYQLSAHSECYYCCHMLFLWRCLQFLACRETLPDCLHVSTLHSVVWSSQYSQIHF